MNHIHILFCLIVAGGAWAACDDACDLNLGSIFRTPKDFSRTNFDHFEILERNNFENQDLPITNEVITTEDQPFRSVANAQVMLRFGGDSINDCNCAAPRAYDIPQFPLVLNEPSYNRYPYYLPAPLRSYSAASPLAFPGSYYRPRSFPGYAVSPYRSYGEQFVPSAVQIESAAGYYPRDTIIEESDDVLDTVRVDNYPTILESSELIDDRFVDGAWRNAPLRESAYLINNRPNVDEEIAVENDSPHFPLLAVIPTPDAVSVNRVIVDSDPCPKKVSYVEVNLADARPCENFDLPTRSIETLLDQSLIPFSCQKCANKQRRLVSYPVINDEVTFLNNPIEEIEVSGCSSCQNYEPCGSCNRQRDVTIPYGKRFAKDLDSLFEVTSYNAPMSYIPSNLYKAKFDEMPVKMWSPLSLLTSKLSPTFVSTTSSPCSTGCRTSPTFITNSPCTPKCSTQFVELKRESPCAKPVIEVVEAARPCADACTTMPTPCDAVKISSSDCTPSCAPEIVTGCGPCGLEKRMYLDGYKRGCGAPYETTIYKRPTFWDLVKIPTTPVIERVEPWAYNTYPKYDTIVAEDEILSAEPFLGSGPYAPDWSYSTGAALVRDAPLYSNYLRRPGCGKYLGGINELDIIA